METIVNLLHEKGKRYSYHYPRHPYSDYNSNSSSSSNKSSSSRHYVPPSVVAITVCENDLDPILSVFQQAGVYRIIYLDSTGMIREQLSVPETLPFTSFKGVGGGKTKTSSSSLSFPLIREEKQNNNNDNNNNTNDDDDDMYIMFTSGTTTTSSNTSSNSNSNSNSNSISGPSSSYSCPKAVVGSHRATYNRLKWFLDTFSSSPRIGRRTKLTFVDGISELWGGLLDPDNVLVSVTSTELRTKGIVTTLVEDMKCTQLLLLPSQVCSQLLLCSSTTTKKVDSAACHPHLERVIVSGEVCSTILLEKFRIAYSHTQLINMYGRTEATGDCLYAILSEMDSDAAVVDNVVAVGRPILVPGVQISLLNSSDKQQQQQQQQKPEHEMRDKQLVIKGTQLSHGYLGCSSSLSQPFDEFIPGDVGFCHNNIWYVRGRVGDVHKINGILTSPNEIEAAFCKTYNVDDCAGVAAVIIVSDNESESNKSNHNNNNPEVFLISTDNDAVHNFSRLHMHKVGGMPFHLIPKRVFLVPNIPRSTTSGAKKIDRKACLRLVQIQVQDNDNDLLLNHRKRKSNEQTTTVVSSIVASVLGIDKCDLDSNKSFLELGGDSATSITLLYRLKEEVGITTDINATDIIWCESLKELENIILLSKGGRGGGGKKESEKARRHRKEKNSRLISVKQTVFVSKGLIVVDDYHRSISLLACVDSTPLVIGSSIISACQGGIILKFSTVDGTLECTRNYPGWMIQADLLLIESTNNLLVCGYNSSTTINKGVVICLTDDLQEERWKIELRGIIKCRPVVIDNVVWILTGCGSVVGLDSTTGKSLNMETQLPRVPSCVVNPIFISSDNPNKHVSIAFATSDWEGGIILFDTNNLTSKVFVDDYRIGPVYKEMNITADSKGVFISDMYGSLHYLSIQTMKISASIQLSSNPLSASTTIIDDNTIVVGSYNGILYCVQYYHNKGLHRPLILEKKWECNCFSSIYSKPLYLRNGSIVVCTTAGFVVNISIDNGDIQSFNGIPAEIWSTPVQVGEDNIIVVGARDSKCHVMALDNPK